MEMLGQTIETVRSVSQLQNHVLGTLLTFHKQIGPCLHTMHPTPVLLFAG